MTDMQKLAEWRADAIMRGGRPAPSDRDPQTRYLANRLVQVIDMLMGAARATPAPEPILPPIWEPQPHVEVVTRYGGHRHLALGNDPYAPGRHRTLCLGTSAWTLASWEYEPDHPLALTVEAMRELPMCPVCAEKMTA